MHPSATVAEDRLDHAGFARRVARVIASVDAADGYVLGLHGAWGSGKSTTMNFVLECVEENNRNADLCDRVVVVEFRPWLITGHQDLIGAFLHVLFEKLAEAGGESRWQRLGGKAKALITRAEAKGLTGAIAKVAAGLAPGGVGHLAEKGLNAAVSALSSPSLQAAHRSMIERLRELDRRFLVTIDDIGRLEAGEIRTVMQMVKSLGRLPNVVYLLCYDREIVWTALDRAAGPGGPSFAEKIVQQELELPVPHRTALLELLAQEIEDLPGVSNRAARWEWILRDGIRRWLRSPRDVVRLSNAVKFSWAAIEGEIDPQDVIAMEGLRLFDAEAFDWARENRPLIFGEGRHFLRHAGTQEPVIDRLRATVPDRVRAEVLELLGVLFPSVAKLLTSAQEDGDRAVPFAGAWPVEDHVDCAKRRGVGSEAGYDTYFGLHPSPDAVPLGEVDCLVAETEARKIKACLVRHLRDRKNRFGKPLIGDLLGELFVRYHGRGAAEPVPAMLEALFAVGEDILGVDADAAASLLIGEMLDRWGPDEGGRRLVEAFRKTESTAFLADVFVARAQERGVLERPREGQRMRISGTDVGVLGDVLREKIEAAEQAGTLAAAPRFAGILASWSYLCGPEAPRRWLTAGMQAGESDFVVRACRPLVAVGLEDGEPTYEMRDLPAHYDLAVLHEAVSSHVGSGDDLARDDANLLEAVVEGSGRLLERVEQPESGSDLRESHERPHGPGSLR